MSNRIERANILKEDAELTEDLVRKAEYLADYHRIMSEETEGFVSERHKIEEQNYLSVVENKVADSDPVVIKSKLIEDLAITVHESAFGESGEVIEFSPVMENLADLDIFLEHGSEYGKTNRIQINGLVEDKKVDFHLYQSSADGKFAIRMLGESNQELIDWFISAMCVPVCEDIEKYDAWKNEVEAKYPEHAGKIRYVGNVDSGKIHISAQVPGHDRTFGVYDTEKNEGQVLSEAFVVHVDDGRDYGDEPDEKDVSHVIAGAEKHDGEFTGHSDKGTYFKFASKSNADNFIRHVSQAPNRTTHAMLTETVISGTPDVDHMPGRNFKYSSVEFNSNRPDKVWYGSHDEWENHINKINSDSYSDNLTFSSDADVRKAEDEDNGHTVGLFDKKTGRGWIIAKHADSIKECVDLYEKEQSALVEGNDKDDSEEDPDEVERKKKWEGALAAVDELGKSMRKTGLPTGANYPAWNERQKHLKENLKEVDGKWALFSRKDPNKVLQWYRGEGQPSDEWVAKVERRVHMFEERDVAHLMLDLEEGYDIDFKQRLSVMIAEKAAQKYEAIKPEVAKGM